MIKNQFYLALYCLIETFALIGMNAPVKQAPITTKASPHSCELFTILNNNLEPQDRRNVRAAFKSIWLETPMPEELIPYWQEKKQPQKLMIDYIQSRQNNNENSIKKLQTNSVFLSAVYYAHEDITNYYVIKWLLDLREDRDFSCYMKRKRLDSAFEQEYHVSPRYIVEVENKDKATTTILNAHNNFRRKQITGILAFPCPLLWACMANDTEKLAVLLNKPEMIPSDKEIIEDCIHISTQNQKPNQHNFVNLLLLNVTINHIHRAYHNESISPRPLWNPVRQENHDEKKYPKKKKCLYLEKF